MTLTVVVGSSGSGKNTFLNDLHKTNQCIYIRQYHNLRPYIKVAKIPRFDPTALPYWDIYEKEIHMYALAPQWRASSRQDYLAAKLLLFEMIYQRTQSSADLLMCVDEPVDGVTDDFVPFITSRLVEMSKQHNVLLVTNDYIYTSSLKKIADQRDHGVCS